MKKLFLTVFSVSIAFTTFSQGEKKVANKIDLSGRAKDHLMIQYGYAGWAGAADSMHQGGFSQSFNAYFLFDFPFKTSPNFSGAIGVGMGTDKIKFKNINLGIKDLTQTLHFTNLADTNHYKRTKLSTTYLEAPIELRYTRKPMDNGKSFKCAIGLKFGTLINAHTKYKTLVNKDDATLNDYVLKESSKRFFGQSRIVGTVRAGVGPVSAFFNYQINQLFKEGVAPAVRPYTIGVSFNGL